MAATRVVSLESVLNDALTLDAEERYHLILQLQETIPPGIPDEGYEEAIREMLAQRLADLDAGRTRLLTEEEADAIVFAPFDDD